MDDDSSPPDILNTTQTGSFQLEDQLKLIASECAQRHSNDGDYNNLPADKKALVLLIIGANSEASEELRCFSLDRLSALLTEVIHTWSSEKLAPFNDVVIKSLLSEANNSITEKMGEILVKVALQSFYLNSDIQVYKSITDFVQNCVRDESSSLKKVALALMKRVPKLFGIAHLSDLRDVLEKALNDVDSAIRFVAAQTFYSVVHQDTIAILSSLLTSIIQITEEFMPKSDSLPSSFCLIESLCELAFVNAILFWPHLNAVIHLCTRVSSETAVELREILTAILVVVLSVGNNSDVNKDSCEKIAHFVLNCPPRTSDNAKNLTLCVVSSIPCAFDDVETVRELIACSLDDTEYFIPIHALRAMMKLLGAHDAKYRLNLLEPLLPNVLKKCSVQLESDDDYYSNLYNPILLIWDIARLDPKLLVPKYFEVIALATNILRKTSTEDGQPLTNPMQTKRIQAYDILYRLFDKGTPIPPNTDSKRDTIAQMCQQLTKYAYSGNATLSRNMIVHLILNIVQNLGGVEEIVEAWSVVINEIKKIPQNDHNLMFTLQIIQLTNVFRHCPSDAPPFFSFCFNHSNESIRIFALEVLAYSILHKYEKEQDNSQQELSKLFPQILSLCKTGSTEEREAARNCLFKVSYKYNTILHSHITDIITYYCQILMDVSEEFFTLQSVVFYVFHISNMPEIHENIVPLVPLILSSGLLPLSQLDDNMVNWEARDHFLEEITHQGVVEKRVQRFNNLVFALKGKEVGQKLLQITTPLLDHIDWKQRYVGVIGLSSIGRVAMTETVPDVLNRITSLLGDTHIRVRSAACFALIRFFKGCDPNLLEKSHAFVIPVLLHTLEDHTCVPRVTAAAAAALAACCNVFPKPVLRDHLSAIMNSAVTVIEDTYRSLLTDGKTRILAQLISLISSMKDVERTRYFILFHQSFYSEYYQRLIRPLKTILTAPNRYPALEATTLECVSLISLAVGEKKCSSDCTEIMHSLMARIDSIFLLWEGEFSSSFGRMASSMGDSFLPFLDPLMMPILAAIRASPNDIDEEGDLVEIDGHEVIGTRKKAACAISTKVATAVGAAFLPYATEMSHLAIAHLTMTIYSGNRHWGRQMMPVLLEYYKAAGDCEAVHKLWSEYWKTIKDAMKEMWGVGVCIKSIGRCIPSLGGLDEEQKKIIGEMVREQLATVRARRLNRKMAMENEMEWTDFPTSMYGELEKSDSKLEESIINLENNLKRLI